MKKMMFLMLTLLIMGAANVNAQVQIGGTKGPDKSAVLDLNGDAGTATGGLALPRVELTSTTQQLNGVTAQPGTVVYNTGSAQLAAGTYVWTQIDGGAGTAFTGISVNNTGANSTIGGTGTPASPLTVNVNANAITATQIANNAVTTDKINALAVTGAKIAEKTIPVSKLTTVAGDSAQVLVSDGKKVYFTNRGGARVDSSSVVLGSVIASPQTTTWTKVFDSTVRVNVRAGSITVYSVTGIKISDMCFVGGGNAWDTVIFTREGMLEFDYRGQGISTSFNMQVKCYRPSI
ncbi:hypothetical protein FACS189437_10840 [Bacteroidia bacterium]|nr:hypothetical protein FACS189437_10840 [Bacteroidia bacterium]